MPLHESQTLNNSAAAREHEQACAQVADRFDERWLRMYARRKLRNDPIFPAAFDLLADSRQPLVDLGCGIGLLAFYLRERKFLPAISGIDRDQRKIKRASAAAYGRYHDVAFFEQDACEPIAARGNIVLFDLLHYLSPNDQTRLLTRLAARVAPGGMLVIRDCPRDRTARFRLTQLAERFAQFTTWNVKTPLHFPTREGIVEAFDPRQFAATIQPLWGRTPFNNYLFVFRRRAAGAAPARAKRSDILESLGDAASARDSAGENPGR